MKWHPSGITRTWIPRETAPATKSEEKRMFSQATRIGEVKTSIDNTTGQRSLFLDSSIFFFQLDSHFFRLKFQNFDSCFFFRSWTYILRISTHIFYCSRCILQFDLRIMFSTCFYYRHNFVRNGTPYAHKSSFWASERLWESLGQTLNQAFFINSWVRASVPRVIAGAGICKLVTRSLVVEAFRNWSNPNSRARRSIVSKEARAQPRKGIALGTRLARARRSSVASNSSLRACIVRYSTVRG